MTNVLIALRHQMESLPDDLLLRVFTIGLVELGEPRLPVVVEDEDGLDHGWAGANPVGAGARVGAGSRASPPSASCRGFHQTVFTY